MKYVIMCGGKYDNFTTPKQLLVVKGERITDRTIRLLKKHGIKDIVITSGNPIFDSCGVPRIEDKKNNFSQTKSWTGIKGWWLDAFYNFNEPTCYLFGDVYYSDEAIDTIVNAENDKYLLFGSNPAGDTGYLIKTWPEPFAFKVWDTKAFFKGINEVKRLAEQKKVNRHPIAWELYRHLVGLDINGRGLEEHFISINDYTTDIDNVNTLENDVERIQYFIDKYNGKTKPLSKVFGVISYIPGGEPARSLRIERLNRLFKQITDTFGDVNWLIVAQNWKDYTIPEYVKNAKIVKFEPLGILRARKTLRKLFLESHYDYLIMCDDDVIIETAGPLIAEAYMTEIDMHPQGFMFLQYQAAQLNMCAISRYIYEKEPMVDVDPQKNEGYEDAVFSNLLHYKYPNNEFHCYGLKCLQWMNKNEKAPSTWSNNPTLNYKRMHDASQIIIENFKKGNFTIDKKDAYEKAHRKEWYDRALMMGWINKEDIGKIV